jgi:hypothetical protein
MQNNPGNSAFNCGCTAKTDNLEQSKRDDFDGLVTKCRQWMTRPGKSPDRLVTSIERFLIGNVI